MRLDTTYLETWPKQIDAWDVVVPDVVQGGFIVPWSEDGQVTKEYANGARRVVLVNPDTEPYMFDPTTGTRYKLGSSPNSSPAVAPKTTASSVTEIMQKILAQPVPSVAPVVQTPAATAASSNPPTLLGRQETAQLPIQSQPAMPAAGSKLKNELKLLLVPGNSPIAVNARFCDIKVLQSGAGRYIALIKVNEASEDSIELAPQAGLTLLVGSDSLRKVYKLDMSEVIPLEIDQYQVKLMRLIEEFDI